MKQRALGYAALAAAIMLTMGSPALAGEGTWVSKSGKHIDVSGHDAMFFAEGATTIQMEDLADGETRVIGVGEKQLTASRRGDEVTITRVAAGESSALDMKCKIGQDTCKILTFADDPGRIMLLIEKTRHCENGEGDCHDVDVVAMAGGDHAIHVADGDHNTFVRRHRIHEAHGGAHGEAGEGMHVIRIKQTVECDAEGNCVESEQVMGDGDDEGGVAEVIIEALGEGAGHHGEMMFIRSGGMANQVTLRCSEGDTTMHVEQKEANDVFLCPKHSTPLEQVKSHPRVMRRKMVREHDDD